MAYEEAKKKSMKVSIGAVKLSDAARTPLREKMNTVESDLDGKHYPSIYVSSDDVQGLKGYKAGDYITIVAHACIKHHSSDIRSNGDKCEDFRLDLEKIGIVAPKKGD